MSHAVPATPARPEPPGLTVNQLFDLYLRYSIAEHVHGPEALYDRQRTLAWFAETHGEMAVADLKPFHLSDWIDGHPGWRSASTRRSKANGIRAAFQWAVNGERISRNPFKSVRYGEAERRPSMPDEALAELLAVGNKRFEMALRFLRLTGCRVSEMCGLTWANVDMAGGLATIQKHKSRKHTGKAKIVVLVPECVELLKEIRRRHTPYYMGVVFLNNRGLPWNRRTLGQHLRRMKKVYGINCKATIHGLRHAWATEAVRSGAPMKHVSMALGHATMAITEKFYVEIAADSAEVRAAALAAQVKGGRP